MNEIPANLAERLDGRLTALETLVTHLERTLQALDDTIRDQHKQLDMVERKLARLTVELGTLSAGPPEVRKPEDELPPHY